MSEHQEFEASWWGDCANTYGEETKQIVYARHMGIPVHDVGAPGPMVQLPSDVYSVIDFGGGPASLLLKTRVLDRAWVVDPCPYPTWVTHRYVTHQIVLLQQPAEEAL